MPKGTTNNLVGRYMYIHVHVLQVHLSLYYAVEVDQPPASSVRRFLALLEQSDIDFSEELGKPQKLHVS